MNAMRLLLCLILIAALSSVGLAAEPPQPNILWITCEDIGPHLGVYGDTYADPPYAYGFRGRMDERYDLVRTVRDQPPTATCRA
jgi:hypothetical protein